LGSLISATDSVGILSAFREINCEPFFYQLIFGESILNDAISIVSYETTSRFDEKIPLIRSMSFSVLQFFSILFFSIFLGYAMGFFTAWILKVLSKKTKKIEKIEIGSMALLPFICYLIAEMLGLSGIVALLFNGFANSTYTKPNLKNFSKIAVKAIYGTLSSLFEILVYIFLGIGFSAFSELFSKMEVSMFVFLTVVVLLARALNIFICCQICNINRKKHKIDKMKQVS
jgi:sodium/hydrogen exchanger 8